MMQNEQGNIKKRKEALRSKKKKNYSVNII